MQRGERIELRGFGVFQVKPRKRGIGRNPRTGKEVRIPPGRTIRFKPGKDLQNIGGSYRLLAAGSVRLRPPVPAPVVVAHPPLRSLTVLTTTRSARTHYLSFMSDFGPRRDVVIELGSGLAGSAGTAPRCSAILGAHEMGHYFACRRYDVDATLPYFLPVPFRSSGTLGAVIKIREAFPTARRSSTSAIAGPIAGFVVARPAAVLGHAHVERRRRPAGHAGLDLGEPLLFQLARWLKFGHDRRRLLGQHASDGLRRVVRDAGDGAEPAARSASSTAGTSPTRRSATARATSRSPRSPARSRCASSPQLGR